MDISLGTVKSSKGPGEMKPLSLSTVCVRPGQVLLAPLRSLGWSNMGSAGISVGLEPEFYGEARLSGQ